MQFTAKVSDIGKQRSACAIDPIDKKNRLSASGTALDETCNACCYLIRTGDPGCRPRRLQIHPLPERRQGQSTGQIHRVRTGAQTAENRSAWYRYR